MQAIILAAGMGKRLKKLTKNNTKCMVEVNGVTLIDRMLHQIEKTNVDRIVIVVGYEGQKLKDYIATLDIKTKIEYVDNPIYDKTNNIYSLSLASDYLCEDDTLLFESDIIFEDSVLDEIVNDPRESLVLVDKYESWMDGTCVTLSEDDTIDTFVPGSKFNYDDADKYYKTVNIYKFSKHFSQTKYIPFLYAYQKALGQNEYYEIVLRVITMLDDPEIKAKRLTGQNWYEIDDIQDLKIAESLFMDDEDKKVELFQNCYGGYWRYPSLLDFCYLVNPYYPSHRLVSELKASFEKLLTQYPSGMAVNSLVAGKDFGVDAENIVVGNGAAELIKSLMDNFEGKTGFIRPTFEEYPNRYNKENSISLELTNKDYSYTKDDIINFFDDKDINNLVIVNPDNPSGNYIPKKDLFELMDWSVRKNINLVIDESFVDFSDEVDCTIIDQDIIDKYNNLYIVKSISKSYGIPGLRLGILVSGNKDYIARIKKDVAIWNINSFGEFYLQIAGKYSKDYTRGLELFRNERKRFKKELEAVNNIRIIDSQASFFMIELTGKMTAKELTKKLLIKYNIFIKDLTKKTGGQNYIRIAIRNTEDNDKLVNAMKELLN